MKLCSLEIVLSCVVGSVVGLCDYCMILLLVRGSLMIKVVCILFIAEHVESCSIAKDYIISPMLKER